MINYVCMCLWYVCALETECTPFILIILTNLPHTIYTTNVIKAFNLFLSTEFFSYLLLTRHITFIVPRFCWNSNTLYSWNFVPLIFENQIVCFVFFFFFCLVLFVRYSFYFNNGEIFELHPSQVIYPCVVASYGKDIYLCFQEFLFHYILSPTSQR